METIRTWVFRVRCGKTISDTQGRPRCLDQIAREKMQEHLDSYGILAPPDELPTKHQININYQLTIKRRYPHKYKQMEESDEGIRKMPKRSLNRYWRSYTPIQTFAGPILEEDLFDVEIINEFDF